MDEISKVIIKEEKPCCEVEDREEERKPIEAIPRPAERKGIYQKVIETRKPWIESELERYAKTQVIAGIRDSARTISDESEENKQVILDATIKHFQNAQTKITALKDELDFLNRWSKYYDSEFNRDALLVWEQRCKEIDGLIAGAKSRILEPFHRGMINVDKIMIDGNPNPVFRFPAERVFQTQDGRYVDRYVMELLKTKEFIYFEPYEKYRSYRRRVYKEICLPALQREQEAERAERLGAAPKAPSPPPVEPQSKGPTWGQMLEEDDSTNLAGRIRAKIGR
jgi:hypothetical protein